MLSDPGVTRVLMHHRSTLAGLVERLPHARTSVVLYRLGHNVPIQARLL